MPDAKKNLSRLKVRTSSAGDLNGNFTALMSKKAASTNTAEKVKAHSKLSYDTAQSDTNGPTATAKRPNQLT